MYNNKRKCLHACCCDAPELCLYLDHEGLPGDLAQVLMAQQLARGQHDAAACGILPPEAPMQIQRLPCIMSALLIGA